MIPFTKLNFFKRVLNTIMLVAASISLILSSLPVEAKIAKTPSRPKIAVKSPLRHINKNTKETPSSHVVKTVQRRKAIQQTSAKKPAVMPTPKVTTSRAQARKTAAAQAQKVAIQRAAAKQAQKIASQKAADRQKAAQKAVQEAQRRAKAEAQRLAIARAQEEARTPIEGQSGLTVGILLDELIKGQKRVHNIFVLHGLVESPIKVQIINAVVQKMRNAQIKNNKAAVTTALIEATVKKRCAKILLDEQNELERNSRVQLKQPSEHKNFINPQERQECINQAFALVMNGKAQNFPNAIERVKNLFFIKKEFTTKNNIIDWKESTNISSFICFSGIQDRALAKSYYDLARSIFIRKNIGSSIEDNRKYLMLILQNQITNEPDKLSAIINKREGYAVKHLRALINSSSPEQYFENLERKKLRDLYHKERRLREINREKVLERLQNESRLTLKFMRKGEVSKGHPLSQDTNEMIDYLISVGIGSSNGLTLDCFFMNPQLVYLLDADKKLPQHRVTENEMQNIYDDLSSALTNYARQHREEVRNVDTLDVCLYNIRSMLLDKINFLTFSNPPELLRQTSMRARMVRAFKTATQGDRALSPNPNVAKAKFALALAQNEPRCADGVNEWLTDFEMNNIYKAPPTAGFSLFVSAILDEEKIRIINLHKPQCAQAPIELQTEGPALLKQRMRLGFGLTIPYSPLSYAGLADSWTDNYHPVRALERFIYGGNISFDVYNKKTRVYDSIIYTIPPFTVDRCVELVRTAWLKKQLNDDILQQEIQKDWVLKKAFERVFDGDAGPKDLRYFKNVVKREEKYTPALFKRLLCRAGFLIDETEPAFY